MTKGNIAIGQSGGPTAAINASLAGAFCAAKQSGIEKIYGMAGGIKGFIDGAYIDLGERIRTEEDLNILKQTPASALGSCRYKLPDIKDDESVYEKLFGVFKRLDIAYFIYIGGNDSMDTIARLSEYAQKIGSDIRFMGVPKTIDNDLAVTDHTPGYGSAAKYIATSVKEIICDSTVYDMKSVTVIEIMGRNAGWLTAAAALARDDDCEGADLIYLPEIPFDKEDCRRRVSDILAKKNSAVIAVSEALRDKSGNYITDKGSVHAGLDAFGHRIMSGTGQFLAQYLGKSLGVKTRGIEINTLQRSAAHWTSARDIEESFAVGEASVNAAIDGQSARMAVIVRTSDEPYSYKIETADIFGIANIEKTVPREWISKENAYVTEDFIKYCRPLILGEPKIITSNGVPRHLKLR